MGQTVGWQVANEAARICGPAGGLVVLVLPDGKDWYRETVSAAYVDGFRAGLRDHRSLKLAGLYFAPPPCRANQYTDSRIPTYSRLTDIRQQYPQAQVIVSLLGLPQFSKSEEQTWLESRPPKLVVVDLAGRADAAALQAGVVQAVITYKHPSELLPISPPGSREDILRNYFDVLRPE